MEEVRVALREAILNGDDAGWGINLPMMVDYWRLQPYTGATVWRDEQSEPQALVLSWKRAQQLFTLLGLTEAGLVPA